MTSWIRRALWGFRALARRTRDDRDLDDELQHYLDVAVEAKVASGMAPAEALRVARAEIGSPAAVEDYVRDVGWETRLVSIWDDVRYAARGLRTAPGFTLAIVITLGLGIGVNTAFFSMLDAVVLRKLSVPASNELVALYEFSPRGVADPVGGMGRYLRFSYPRFIRLQQALGSHGSLAAMTQTNLFAARVQHGPQISIGLQLVSANYFDTFRVPPARGRMLTAADASNVGAPVAVVSDAFWKSELNGVENVLGQTLAINDVTATVVGVAPPGFTGAWIDDNPDVWLPLTLQPVLPFKNNTSSYGRVDMNQSFLVEDRIAWLNLVGRIGRRDRSLSATLLQNADRQGLIAFAEAGATDARERASILEQRLGIEPLAHGFSRVRARQSNILLALMSLVLMILLLTSANVANLLLVRTGRRRREVAVRVALGATTSRIVRHALTEAFLLAGLGGLAGVLAAGWSRHLLARQVVGTSRLLPEGFSLDGRTLLFAATASVATALIAGLVPALRAARAGGFAAAGLNDRHPAGIGTMKGMRPLVVVQLALSVVIVFAATLLGRSLLNLVRIDPGFTTELVSASFFNAKSLASSADRLTALADGLVLTAQGVPGAKSAAVSVCGLLAGCSYSTSVRIEGFDGTADVYQNWVGANYFTTVGLPVLRGREFDGRDSEHGPPVAIITDSIARRYFPKGDAIGRHLSNLAAGQQYDTEIVGVVGDLRPVSLRDSPVAMVFYPLSRRRADAVPTALDIRISGDPDQAVGMVREALKRAEPALTATVTSMPTRLAKLVERDRAVAYLTSAFAGLALLLASIGLYGVLSYVVTQRYAEIGLRMALGAQRSEVLALVFKQGSVLAVVGLTLGLAAAPFATKSLQSMFFEVSPLDPQVFFGVTLVMLVVAVLATIIPARRATKVDPIVALRCE